MLWFAWSADIVVSELVSDGRSENMDNETKLKSENTNLYKNKNRKYIEAHSLYIALCHSAHSKLVIPRE